MKIEKPEIGQRVFQASLYKYGRDVDHDPGDLWTAREEAEQDGECMASDYDTEWQKRNPGAISYVVREYVVDSIDDFGAWGGYTVD